MAADRPPFHVEPEVLAVLETLWDAGHAAYLVGGGVRDALLGTPVSDWDVATDARPERLLRLFPGATYKNRFGTVLARELEITTFRRDHRYADHRRPDSVTFSQDIFEDLARRDLTINAIAWGRRGPDATAQIVDPADGRGDLDARLVRAVGDPAQRFDEDALRLLRAVRIAARLDFTIEPMTRAAIVAHADDIGYVSEERIGAEVAGMLTTSPPSRAFRLLDATGLLRKTLPELAELAEPAAGDSLDALARRPADLDAAMRTLDAAVSAHPGHERLAWAALLSETDSETARRALERLRLGGREAMLVAELVEAANVSYEEGWSDADVRRYMGRVRPDALDDVLALRVAKASGAPEAAESEATLARRVADQRAARTPLRLADLAIDGGDLRETLGMPESPTVGVILERLLADVIDDPTLNDRSTLLTRANLILDELVRRGGAGADRPAIG